MNKFWNWIWQWNTARSLLVSLALLIGVPLLIYDFLSDFVKIKSNTEIALIEITELMKGLNSIALAFVALVAAPFAIWRMSLTSKQTDINQQTHYTDNYFKALDQLTIGENNYGENIAARVGAIYGLGNIIQQSEKHHFQITSMLASFIRNNLSLSKKANY